MGQQRYFASAPRAQAQAAFDRLDATFGEDGAPIAIIEIDEAADIHEVSAYFENPDQIDPASIRAVFAPLTPEVEDLPDIDWMASVLADLKPVRAGRFLVHGAHDRDRVEAGDIGIEIEAGQAFGTGHHGTTAGCLMLIDEIVQKFAPANALDLGTGSAVLAIAVAKLAEIPVLATDIDPVAVDVAEENVRGNGTDEHVKTVVATGFDSPAFQQAGPFDLIIANILAGPLMTLAPEMEQQLAPGGNIILSGILTRQRDDVLGAYLASGLHHRKTVELGEWVTLHLTR
ncbi:50S ribosomal protein L11 methyltransferase [Aureimonas fodinaquatilis]|uniref:Ribosomal protein L11 methyltransferase n=1 Tax=Aureimonas fodinaquatilis TaxID=2565783 RepID=A0A5B0E1R3_9HYPH|nr:50S ribosomal protein L11 methyltransferase [Aureimonas fodinaquatilis]KAA0972598.1 50S ribosomal protein L11 methyltransferase [Aureimonas fodinaquatilis]